MQTVPRPRLAPRFDMCKTEPQLTRHPGVVIPDTMVDLHVGGTTQIAWAPETLESLCR